MYLNIPTLAIKKRECSASFGVVVVVMSAATSSGESPSSEDDDGEGRKAGVKGRKADDEGRKADDEGREGMIVSGNGPPFVRKNGFAGVKADPRPKEDDAEDVPDIVSFCVAQL